MFKRSLIFTTVPKVISDSLPLSTWAEDRLLTITWPDVMVMGSGVKNNALRSLLYEIVKTESIDEKTIEHSNESNVIDNSKITMRPPDFAGKKANA